MVRRFGVLMVVFSVAVLCAAWCDAEPGTSFYVSPAGNDGNPGTKEQPFQTITKARDAVRAISATASGDIVVNLAGGTYALDETLRFDSRDSGRNGHNIVYAALPGEMPVIGGGKSIKGWERDGDTRWKALVDVADLRQLYVNGIRAVRARGPVPEGVGRYGNLSFIDGDAGHTFPKEVAALPMVDWRNPADIEFGYYNSWGHMICKVKLIARDGSGGVKVAMQQPWFTLASRKEGVQIKLPAYIDNAFELLDEPGEWYLDKPAHVVYYVPRPGENLETASVVAPVLETLVEVRGTLDDPVHNIRFEGVTFADATWLSPNRQGHIDEQANFSFAPTNIFERDGLMVNLHNEYLKSPANVVLHAAHAIQFERCEFMRLGGAGLDLEYGSQDNIVSGCHFHDISGSAIQVGDVLKNDHHPDDARLIVRNNRITNNDIHHIGVEFQDSVGVFGGYVQETLIAHNEIHDLPYSGVSVGWGWGEEDAGGGGYVVIPFRYEQPTPARDNRIECNHIHDVMLLRNDGGGIYTLGNQPGTVIKDNHIHDNNKGGGPGGIYCDEGSGFIEITGNSVYNVETPMNYNNRSQDRIKTCREHDNHFGVKSGDAGFPQAVADGAGLEPAYRNGRH